MADECKTIWLSSNQNSYWNRALPTWSSGYDSALSPPRPGFDSRRGNSVAFSYSSLRFIVPLSEKLRTVLHSILFSCQGVLRNVGWRPAWAGDACRGSKASDLFTRRWGTPSRWSNTRNWGNPPLHVISYFIWSCFHDRWGNQSGWVAQSAR